MLTLTLALLFAAAPGSPVAKLYDGQLKMVEAEVITLAEAMPAEKYGFAPEGDGFKDVRTFGAQVGHIGDVTYQVAAAILKEKVPSGVPDVKSLKSKEELVNYLKASVAYAHKAVATISDSNLTEAVKSPFGDGDTTRLNLGGIFLWHSMDHYGQMVVYARMNGVTPPASKN